MWLDGTLGGRTAALREPDAGDPENQGMLLYSDETVEVKATWVGGNLRWKAE